MTVIGTRHKDYKRARTLRQFGVMEADLDGLAPHAWFGYNSSP